jgi:hypothetical protein
MDGWNEFGMAWMDACMPSASMHAQVRQYIGKQPAAASLGGASKSALHAAVRHQLVVTDDNK